jgi:hypothetical protein
VYQQRHEDDHAVQNMEMVLCIGQVALDALRRLRTSSDSSLQSEHAETLSLPYAGWSLIKMKELLPSSI